MAGTWICADIPKIVDARVPLDALIGAEAQAIADWASEAQTVDGLASRLERAIATRARLHDVQPALPRAIHAFLQRRCTYDRFDLDRLASACDMSVRTLRRRCVAAYGYGPKTLDRILRFQRFLKAARSSQPSHSLAALAAAAGYSDQAHLTREARRLAAMTPGTILSQIWGVRSVQDTARPNAHVCGEAARSGGATSRT